MLSVLQRVDAVVDEQLQKRLGSYLYICIKQCILFALFLRCFLADSYLSDSVCYVSDCSHTLRKLTL